MIHPAFKHCQYACACSAKPVIEYLESTGWIFMENSFNKYTDVNKEAPSANYRCIPSYASDIFQTQRSDTWGVSTAVSVE
jgi:hypothetical protein